MGYHKMELKKHQLLLSTLFLHSVSFAAARTITELKLQTSCIPFSGCDFCSISATIVPGPDQECTTPVLDNPGDNDLQTCDENIFSGPVIGECNRFPPPTAGGTCCCTTRGPGAGGATTSTSSWTT